MSEQRKTKEEWLKEIKEHRCNLCECDPRMHAFYWSCPLFEGEEICQNCCQVDTLREDVAETFSKSLGRPISLDEINEACRKCGKNYGLQNEQLADDIENTNKMSEVNDDEKPKAKEG